MTFPTHEWIGSTDASIKSGDATFRMLGQEVRIRMYSFSDFHGICELLNIVYDAGKRQGARAIVEAARHARDQLL